MNELATEWVEALRSGKYEQGTDCLRGEKDNAIVENAFCCLGVLCDIHPGVQWKKDPYMHWVAECSIAGTIYGSLTDPLLEEIGLTDAQQEELIRLNDKQGWDFNEIATAVEEMLSPVTV